MTQKFNIFFFFVSALDFSVVLTMTTNTRQRDVRRFCSCVIERRWNFVLYAFELCDKTTAIVGRYPASRDCRRPSGPVLTRICRTRSVDFRPTPNTGRLTRTNSAPRRDRCVHVGLAATTTKKKKEPFYFQHEQPLTRLFVRASAVRGQQRRSSGPWRAVFALENIRQSTVEVSDARDSLCPPTPHVSLSPHTSVIPSRPVLPSRAHSRPRALSPSPPPHLLFVSFPPTAPCRSYAPGNGQETINFSGTSLRITFSACLHTEP